jgi:hypothetical protein
MPKRHSIKHVITPFDLQGSEGDEAFIKYKPPTMQEAQNLRTMQQEINLKSERALSDYAAELGKLVTELTDGEKMLAYDKVGLTDVVINKGNETIASFILEWNWVDDDGNALTQPKDDPTVLVKLYPQEYNYVMSLLSGNSDPKN